MGMEIQDIQRTLFDVLDGFGAAPSGGAFDPHFHFLDGGRLDSFTLVQFVMTVEETFGFVFAPEDLDSEEFRSMGGLAALIGKRLGET